MIEIKDLLSRINNTLFKEEMKRETIRNVLSETLKVEIKKENIRIKNNIIYLNIKPIYKNEILLKREIIFSKLNQMLGKNSPGDIR